MWVPESQGSSPKTSHGRQKLRGEEAQGRSSQKWRTAPTDFWKEPLLLQRFMSNYSLAPAPERPLTAALFLFSIPESSPPSAHSKGTKQRRADHVTGRRQPALGCSPPPSLPGATALLSPPSHSPLVSQLDQEGLGRTPPLTSL